MKKFKLEMDALAVESFEPILLIPTERGTVHARRAVANVYGAGTDASNCATCETCQGPNCCGCANSTAT